MKVELKIPNQDEIMLALKCAGGALAVIAAVNAVSKICHKIKEKKQEKEIKALKEQVAEQDARIAKLEKAKA